MEKIFGGLIEFPSEKEFDKFIDDMDVKDTFSIIEKSIEYAHNNNIYDVRETYFIYRVLNKIRNFYEQGT
jgi:hypothetical protein